MTELKAIALIGVKDKESLLDANRTLMWLPPTISAFNTNRLLNLKTGDGLPLPNGSNLLISSIKLLFIELGQDLLSLYKRLRKKRKKLKK